MACLGDRKPLSEQNMETDGFLQAKVLDEGAFYLPIFFNLHAEHGTQNTGLDAERGVKTERNSKNLRCADGTISLAESSDRLERLLMTVKEASGRAGLHVNIENAKVMITEEIHNCNRQWRHGNRQKFFLPWFSHQFKWTLQPRTQGKAKTREGSNGRTRKVTRNTDVSSESRLRPPTPSSPGDCARTQRQDGEEG